MPKKVSKRLFPERRGEEGIAEENFPNRGGQIAGKASFGDVAGSSCGKRRRDVLSLFVNGKEEDFRARVNLANAQRSLNAVQEGHGDIDHKDIGIMVENCLYGFLAIRGSPDDVEVLAQLLAKISEEGFTVIRK